MSTQPYKPPPNNELRENFRGILDGILAGKLGGCPTSLGMDLETFQALDELAQLHTRGLDTTAAIYDARAEFERQLDGTHARAEEQRTLDLFRELDRGA